MGKIKLLAWSLGFLFACGLLVVAVNGHLPQFASAHRSLPSYFPLYLLLAIPAGILTLGAAYLLEWLHVGWSRSSLRTLLDASGSVRLDVLSGAMALVPHRWFGYALSLGLLYAVDSHLVQQSNLSLTRFLPSWGLQIACLLLLQSCISYWMHRLEHSVPALWALHKFHHSADRISILTTARQTDLSKGAEQIIVFLFPVLLSEPTTSKPDAGSPLFALVILYFAYRAVMGVNHYLCHSNLSTDYGWIGRWLLVSPRMHRLHHAVSPEYHDKNFTFDLVIWDRLFGTYATCDAAVIESLPLGLGANPFDNGGKIRSVLGAYFLTPYVEFWHALRSGFKAWLPGRLGQRTVELGPGT